jgi:hypothetical protein
MRIITTRQELTNLARELDVCSNWHEPDEQGLTARVEGFVFDNAGFWPTAEALRHGHLTTRSVEQHVILTRTVEDEYGNTDTDDVAAINLATLLAWACGSAE